MNYLSVFSQNAEHLLNVLDRVVRDTDSKVRAANTSILFNDVRHNDVAMCGVTFETSLTYDQMCEEVQKENLHETCFVREELPEEWKV